MFLEFLYVLQFYVAVKIFLQISSVLLYQKIDNFRWF